MKKIFILLFVGFAVSISAQQVNVLSVEKIQATGNGGFYYPRFSPAGDYLLLSKVNYAGLTQYNFGSRRLQTLTDDSGAGYDVQFSADGKTILYKKTELINRLRYSSLVSQVVSTGAKNVVVKPTRDALKGEMFNSQPAYIKGKSMVKAASEKGAQLIVTTENKKMVVYKNGIRKEVLPNGADESYFWCSISPDGKSLVYTVAGKGTFTSTIEGKEVKKLGKLSAPVWAGNNYVVGMDDVDNGEKLISSKIVIKSADGKFREDLDVKGVNAMYPAVSGDCKKIACNTEDGQIYIINVELK